MDSAPPENVRNRRFTGDSCRGAGPTRLADVKSAEEDPSTLARRAAETLAELTGVPRHDVALVLGSGWLPAADRLGTPTAEIEATDLPGFGGAAVEGHSGKIRSVRVGEADVLLFLSRTHFYEGKGVRAVVHPVRTAAAAGCHTIVLTNGCGGLDESWTPARRS